MSAGYTPCPFSLEPDARGEPHPHHCGEWFVLGVQFCAVCERIIPRGAIEDALYRAEARRELLRITGRAYWLPTPSDPPPGTGGSTPQGGPRPIGRKEAEP
jgi:hypothetical protein